MVTTRDRLDELTGPRQEPHGRMVLGPEDAVLAPTSAEQPAGAPDRPAGAVPRRPLGARLQEPITGRWAATAGVAWVVLLAIGIAVEPPPTDPNAVDPWFVSALATVMLVALPSAFAGFWLRRRWSLAASLVASGILVFFTVMCPVSGHHGQVGAWWVVQLGCGLGLVTTSVLGLRRA